METERGRIADTIPALVRTALPDGHTDFLRNLWRD